MKGVIDTAKHIVKCYYCGKSFDASVEPFEKPLSNRYAHLECAINYRENKTQEQKDNEEKSGTMADYNIFMAMVEKVGHDRRGTPTFKRDNEGNEILIPDTNSVLVLDETSDGSTTVSHEQKKKVEDDQTPDVPEIFAEWKKQEGISW